MRLPSGYGSVQKLSGNRRNPYVARITTGWAEDGRQIREYIGYYKTRKEALQALSDYHNDPYDLEASKLTFSQIYEKWSEVFFDDNTNRSTRKNYTNAYKFCTALYDLKISDIKLAALQSVIDNATCGSNTLKRIKILFNKLYDYCIKRDILTKNYSEHVVLPKIEQKTARKAFTSADIDKIWEHSKASYTAKIALILIYSGVRINELLNLKKENLFLDEQYFCVIESKTVSGIRVVPIADKVLDFWKEISLRSQCDFVFTNSEGKKFTDDNFRKRYWHPMMQELNLNYLIHETRHTCISLLASANVNQTVIKHIVGHKSTMSLTESVYTHFDVSILIDAINKI